MAKPPLDSANPFDYRVGSIDGFILGGVMKDPDPGSTPHNRPRSIINGRFEGGAIVSRPPYQYVDFLPDFDQKTGDPIGGTNTQTYSWDIKFMTEHHPTRFNNQLWVGRFDGNSSQLQVVTQPFKQPEDVASYPSLISKPPIVERFNNEIFVGDTGYLRRIYRIGGTLADLPTDDILYTFDGFRVYAMHEYAGRLFVFVADPTGVSNSYVFSYDGATVYSEVTLTTAGKDGASFVEYNGRLFLGTKGDSLLRIRDATGSWSTQAQTGGAGTFTHSGFGNAMWVAGTNILYIAGDANFSTYTELSGTPALISNIPPFGGAGIQRVLVGCSIGHYGFYGGTVIRSGDTYYTPCFYNQDAGQINPDKIGTEDNNTDVIPKACAVFSNRLYFAFGKDDISYGGSSIGFFGIPRSVLTRYQIQQVGAPNTSIEYMKGDH